MVQLKCVGLEESLAREKNENIAIVKEKEALSCRLDDLGQKERLESQTAQLTTQLLEAQSNSEQLQKTNKQGANEVR